MSHQPPRWSVLVVVVTVAVATPSLVGSVTGGSDATGGTVASETATQTTTPGPRRHTTPTDRGPAR